MSRKSKLPQYVKRSGLSARGFAQWLSDQLQCAPNTVRGWLYSDKQPREETKIRVDAILAPGVVWPKR